jgi:hypothetical protein
MRLNLYLLSRMNVGTSSVLDSFYMLVLGMGLGGVMQVLVIIAQNAVPHSELGVATSGATFFRSIGGSFGLGPYSRSLRTVSGVAADDDDRGHGDEGGG